MIKCNILLGAFCSVVIIFGVVFQVQAITITFDDAVGDSAETFYYDDYGVTFSGGGLLVHGSSGGLPGQPVFHGGGIGTFSKVSGSSYSDSYFDIWVHFEESAYDVSGGYRGNLGMGGNVFAYDDSGAQLAMSYIDASVVPPTNVVGTVGTFDFGGVTNISHLHMISDRSSYMTGLDNLTFNHAPIPEPATVLLFGTGLVGLVGSRLRQKKKYM